MLEKSLRWAAIALGVTIAVGARARADDTYRLDVKKSTDAPAITLGGVGAFSHDARAKPDDDDLEDVFFGYARGYIRGQSGCGYVIPRFAPFRAGYYAGRYGYGSGPCFCGGYYGYGYGSLPPYNAGYSPSYYAVAPAYHYAQPPLLYYPRGGYALASASGLALTARPLSLRLDEPPNKQLTKTTYRYDSGPVTPLPMPQLKLSTTELPAEGRIVRLETGKKLAYPAYGDHRKKAAATDDYRTVKQIND